MKTDEAADDEVVAQLLGGGGDMLLDGDFGVAFDEALVEKADAAVEFFEFSFDDFGDGLRGLVLDLFGGDFLFLGDEGGIELLAGDDHGVGGGDLQGDVADELLEILGAGGGVLAGADLDEDTNLGAGVDVGGDHAVAADLETDGAGHLDVLADFSDGGDAFGFERFDGGLPGQFAGHFIAEGLESFVASDEIGFAIDFDQDADFGAGLDVLGNDAVFGFARCFLGGAGDAALAQKVHGAFDAALGFNERLFAIHQTGAGHFTELGHVCCGKICHCLNWLRVQFSTFKDSNPQSPEEGLAPRMSGKAKPN